MAPTWKPAEVKRMASTIRNYSVNNQVDVTDATWKSYLPNFDQFHAKIVQEDATRKSYLPNFDQFHAKIVQEDAQWTRTASQISQMQTKWKNMLQDYYNVKSNNATTGAMRKTVPCMDDLDELVSADNPNIASKKLESGKPPKTGIVAAVGELETSDTLVEPVAKRARLNPVDQLLVQALSPPKPDPVSLEVAKINQSIAKKKSKEKLFTSFEKRSIHIEVVYRI